MTPTPEPALSIITTVYDRVACLRDCIASVRALTFKNYEHIIVSDHPGSDTATSIQSTVTALCDHRISYYDLPERHNNWGISPADYGLKKARGQYVAFLSDDNGYASERFEPLVNQMNADPKLSFVYTACYYKAFGILNYQVPLCGKIDLGQPLFRKSYFERLNNSLPFNQCDWDWQLIDLFITYGSWKFFDKPTFIFKLRDYPQFIV